MKEVKKCSISGIAFTLDADAYALLSRYLDSLKATYAETADGDEIVADIEARIAELILSQQENSRVVETPLLRQIISQMGTAEDISSESETDAAKKQPRIPRRLYRDTENARLGGVCAGLGRYFDVDATWVRLTLFAPLLLLILVEVLPFSGTLSTFFSNLFGVFVLGYFIMWFAVPAARSARQKLEMEGEPITVRSIREKTVRDSETNSDVKSIVARVIYALGQLALIVIKIFIGFFIFGLTFAACILLIVLFALIFGDPGGSGTLSIAGWTMTTTAMGVMGLLTVLIPLLLLIYILFCLIASRKPGGKTVLAIFLLWLASIIAVSCVAIRENVGDKFRTKRRVLEQVFQSEIVIDGDTTTLERLLEENDDESVIEEGRKTLHINENSKYNDNTVDKKQGVLPFNADGRKVSVKASETGDEASVTIRRETDAADSAKTTRGSAARSR